MSTTTPLPLTGKSALPPDPKADIATHTCQRRLPNPQIRRNPFAWSTCWSAQSERLPVELFTMLDHLFGLLLRSPYAQVIGANPLRVQTDSPGTALTCLLVSSYPR